MEAHADNRPLRGKRILIIEDNFLIAELLSSIMAGQGCFIEGPVGTAERARKIIDELPLDGVLLNLQLCEGNGIEVGDMLRHRCVPFIVVTGYMPEYVHSVLQEAPYVGKPVVAEELIRLAIRTFVRGSNNRK